MKNINPILYMKKARGEVDSLWLKVIARERQNWESHPVFFLVRELVLPAAVGWTADVDGK